MKLKDIIAEINPTATLTIIERIIWLGEDMLSGECVWHPDTHYLESADGNSHSLDAEYDMWEFDGKNLIVWEEIYRVI